MKKLGLILLAFLLVTPPLRAQLSGAPVSASRDNSVSPLLLSINGGGRVIRFFSGDILPTNRKFGMWAIPEPGYAFMDWQPANVFIFTLYTTDEAGKPVATTSTVWSPVPEYQRSPFLEFTEELDGVIFDVPGVETITQGKGWVANFAPIRR